MLGANKSPKDSHGQGCPRAGEGCSGARGQGCPRAGEGGSGAHGQGCPHAGVGGSGAHGGPGRPCAATESQDRGVHWRWLGTVGCTGRAGACQGYGPRRSWEHGCGQGKAGPGSGQTMPTLCAPSPPRTSRGVQASRTSSCRLTFYLFRPYPLGL